MSPIPEAIFMVSFSMCQFQLTLSSIVIIPSDLVVATCFTRVSFIKIEGEAAIVFNLWPDPICINSVLVIFRVSLLAFNQVCTFNRSSLRHDSMLPTCTLLSAYVRCASSTYILGSQCDKQLVGHLYIIRIRVDRGWSPHGCQIRAHQLSIVVYGSPSTIETILMNSQTYHKSQA